MSSEQIAMRIISMECKVKSHILRSGKLNVEQFQDLVNATQEIHNLGIFLDDTPALSISALRSRARRLKRKNNLSLLIVDYLQLVRGSSHNSNNRVQEVSEVTQGLKAIAKELNIPVIALSQLSRAVEAKEDKRPELSHLRESGSIEQDADIVMFIYRSEYYLERDKPIGPEELHPDDKEGFKRYETWHQKWENMKNKTEIIIAKHRNGPVGNVMLYFDSEYTRFSNLTKNN